MTKAEIAKRIKGLEATLAELRESLTADEPVTKLGKSVSSIPMERGELTYEPTDYDTGI